MNKLTIQLSAGKIKRYHTHPITGEQTVGDHTYGVVQILRYITEDNCSKVLLMAALDHDVVEFYTGDVPYPAKKQFPILEEVLGKIEDAVRQEHLQEINSLTEEDKLCLKAADLLEMASFGVHQWKLGNSFGLGVTQQVIEELKQMNQTLLPQKAKELIIEIEAVYSGSK